MTMGTFSIFFNEGYFIESFSLNKRRFSRRLKKKKERHQFSNVKTSRKTHKKKKDEERRRYKHFFKIVNRRVWRDVPLALMFPTLWSTAHALTLRQIQP